MSSVLQHHRQMGNVLQHYRHYRQRHYRQTLAVVVENLEDIWGQIGQVYLCIWHVALPSGQLTSYFILASSLTWASMSLKASRAPSNQVSRRCVTLARHRPAGFAAGKNVRREGTDILQHKLAVPLTQFILPQHIHISVFRVIVHDDLLGLGCPADEALNDHLHLGHDHLKWVDNVSLNCLLGQS